MFLEAIYCPVCHQTKTVGVVAGEPHPGICNDCKLAAQQEEKRKELDPLKLMSVEDRLSRIEEVLYDIQHQPTAHRWDG